MATEEKLVSLILDRCRSWEEIKVLAREARVSLDTYEEPDDLKKGAQLLVAKTVLSGRKAELEGVLTRPGIRKSVVVLNVLLVAAFLSLSPLSLRHFVPWYWSQLAVAGGVVLMAWSIWKIVAEPSVLRFVQFVVADEGSTKRLLFLVLGTTICMLTIWLGLPAADAPILRLLPYGGTLTEELDKGAYLVVRYDDKVVKRVRNKKGAAMYLGWPERRVEWKVYGNDRTKGFGDHQDALDRIATRLLLATESDPKLAPSIAAGWATDPIFATPVFVGVRTPRRQARVMVTLESSGQKRELFHIDLDVQVHGTFHRVKRGEGIETLVLIAK